MEKVYKLKGIPKSTPKTIELTKKFQMDTLLNEVFIGKILGDASINKTGNLCISQGIAQKEYIEHCFTLFKNYIRPGRQINSYMNKRKGKLHEILSFETCAIFKEYLPLFYRYEENTNKRIKIIPENIGEMLTLRSLAYWIMDDGGYKSGRVTLSTHSFTLQENIFLATIIENKFSLDCTIVQVSNHNKIGDYWYVIKINDTSLLWSLVQEYILPSFYYKFGTYAKPKLLANN